jgi:hypothetical protein
MICAKKGVLLMFGLDFIFSVFSSSSNDFEEEIDEDYFYEESQIDINSSICSVHEGNVLAQSGNIIHEKDIKELQKEVFSHTYD